MTSMTDFAALFGQIAQTRRVADIIAFAVDVQLPAVGREMPATLGWLSSCRSAQQSKSLTALDRKLKSSMTVVCQMTFESCQY